MGGLEGSAAQTGTYSISVPPSCIAPQAPSKGWWFMSDGMTGYGWDSSSPRVSISWPWRMAELLVRVRFIRNPPARNRQNTSLTNIKTGPRGATEVIPQDTKVDAPKSKDIPSVPSPSDPVPRGLRITRDILETYDLTKGCPKCEAIRRDDDSNTVHHNRECRKRIEAAMTQDVEVA